MSCASNLAHLTSSHCATFLWRLPVFLPSGVSKEHVKTYQDLPAHHGMCWSSLRSSEDILLCCGHLHSFHRESQEKKDATGLSGHTAMRPRMSHHLLGGSTLCAFWPCASGTHVGAGTHVAKWHLMASPSTVGGFGHLWAPSTSCGDCVRLCGCAGGGVARGRVFRGRAFPWDLRFSHTIITHLIPQQTHNNSCHLLVLPLTLICTYNICRY